MRKSIERARDALRLRLRLARRKSRTRAAQEAFARRLAALRPGDVAVDCGANVGLFSERLAQAGATVHAFEPDPDAFAALSARMARFSGAVLHEAAVGAAEGRAALFASTRRRRGDTARSASSSLLNESRRVADAPFAEVRVIDFPAYLRGLAAPPALIKIDIEGAEVALLEALLDEGLLDPVGAVFVETHEKQLPSLRRRTFALIDRARAHGDKINFDWI